MPIPTDVNQLSPYVLEAERKQEGAATFHLRPISGADAKMLISAGVGEEKVADVAFDVLLCCLAGWDRFTFPDGRPVPFVTEHRIVRGRKRDVPNEATMNFLSMEVIAELSAAVKELNTLSKDAQKN